MPEPFVVGLAGGSASGKTTLISELESRFRNNELCVISLDHYYKPLSQQLRDANGIVNFDNPYGIDYQRLNKDLAKLKRGKEVQIVEYTFNNPSQFPTTLVFKPAQIILIEGIFVYSDSKLKKKFDLRLWIDTPEHLAFERRLKRDLEERGMREDDIRYQWENHVIPARRDHLDPHKKDVHLVLENKDDLSKGLKVLVELFRSQLAISH